MTIALILLHAAPETINPRADTAIRLAGAMLADGKEVRLFLAGQGVLLLSAPSPATQPTYALFQELIEAGLTVQCCGTSLKRQGMSDHDLPRGVERLHEGPCDLDERGGGGGEFLAHGSMRR
jgi:uncharacterized protein involved in oxidation of intracellular sulfur